MSSIFEDLIVFYFIFSSLLNLDVTGMKYWNFFNKILISILKIVSSSNLWDRSMKFWIEPPLNLKCTNKFWIKKWMLIKDMYLDFIDRWFVNNEREDLS